MMGRVEVGCGVLNREVREGCSREPTRLLRQTYPAQSALPANLPARSDPASLLRDLLLDILLSIRILTADREQA